MLAGHAVVAIWNDITDEGRAEFYAWHLHEHMAERTAIPGFLRGRRYAGIDGATPAFFTLYEAEDMATLQGPGYLARLNAPSPWTRTATAAFRNTSRALARVLATHGPGAGAVALTLRFDAPSAATTPLRALLRQAATRPRITGAHLCAADPDASAATTAESAGRTDLQRPPTWFAMLEATDPAALDGLLPDPDLLSAGTTPPLRGLYRLEYTQGKTPRL